MQPFSLLLENLNRKARALGEADARLKRSPTDPIAWLDACFERRDFTIFCGAGISAPAPASAPTFIALRNAVVLALADLLLARGRIEDAHREAVGTAVQDLQGRVDLSVPPEFVFGEIEDTMGMPLISRLLNACLDGGLPNENHLALVELARRRKARFKGIITPNFDLYLEKAFAEIPLRRTVIDVADTESGFDLSKPHGSLDRPGSLAITISTVAKPLRGNARRSFEDLTKGRTVVVIGYSGWDYDLFPLLVHAGHHWGSDIVWVAYNEASINERVAMMQLALGDRCTILNSREKPLLPPLAGMAPRDAGHAPGGPDLVETFTRELGGQTDDVLASALVALVTPFGTPEQTGVVARACDELLHIAEQGGITDDELLLERLSKVAAYGSLPARKRAAELAVACGNRLGRKLVVAAYQKMLDGSDDGNEARSARSRLRKVERDLEEFPFAFTGETHPDLAERSVRLSLRIERARLLMTLGRDKEAEDLVHQILNDTRFAESGVSEEAYIVDDGRARYELDELLGGIAADRRDTDAAEKHFCDALDGLWNELALWELHEALARIAGFARGNRDCVAAAMRLSVDLARFTRNVYEEYHALVWQDHYRVSSPADKERLQQLGRDYRMDSEST